MARQVAQRREQLQRAQAVIEGAGDKVLAGFGAYVEAELERAAAQGTEAELARLTELQALADKLVAFLQREWQDNIDRGKFARESQVHRGFDGTVTRQTLTAWLTQVKQYRKATAEEVVKAVRAIERVAKSPVVNAAWVRRRDLALRLHPLPELKKEGEKLSAFRAGASALQAFLAGLDDAQALPRGMSPEARETFPEALRPALSKLLARHREKALENLVGRIPWGDDGFPAVSLRDFKASDAWKAETARYAAFRESLVAGMKQARRIPAYLDAGYLPEDTPRGAEQTVADLYDRWQQFRKAAPPLRQALPGLDQRMAALEALEGLHRDGLVERARSLQPDEPPQVPLMVWRRLGTVVDWPATLEELDLEVQLRERVAAVARRLGTDHPHAVRWVAPALSKEGTRRWEVCFRSLLPEEAPTEADDQKLAKVLARREALDVEEKWLHPTTRFRVALIELRQGLSGLAEKGEKPKARRLMDAFRQRVSALPDIAQSPPVLQFLGQAYDILKQEDGGAGGGLERAGPALYPHAGGWKPQVSADGRAVTYGWGKGHSLRFLLVDATRGQGRPAYLCTTEFSLGLFIDTVAAANQWHQVSRLLKRYDLIADPRKGPRVWERTRDGDGIKPSRRWLVPLPGVRRPYPQGLSPPQPAGEHPMQYVSPSAALFVARLLGCRLPTAAEWRAAAAQAESQSGNLRDATWKRQQAHVRGLWAGGVRADWPDAGIFLPADAQVAFEGNAGAVTDRDDGVLWFAPAAGSGGFQHLVGNVAEFVFEAPGAFEAAFGDRGDLTARAVRGFVEQQAGKLAVIGGSALSPPEVWNGREKGFGTAWP
ncbi:MAG: SUMF1/EgtB/PvdO family nonheme iron enzyme, partial [bacterium]